MSKKPITINEIARTCHETNRAFCEATGDFTQVPWLVAPNWQQDITIAGVEMLLANPTFGPRESHQAWKSRREMAGWSYGETRSDLHKTDPSLALYDELSDSQKVKDELFVAVVRSTQRLM